MKAYRYYSNEERELVSSRVFTADNFFQRLFGLILMRPLSGDESLLIKGCKSIHTMGMKYIIDVVFIDRGGKIVAIFELIRPWKLTPHICGSKGVIEFRAGIIREKSLSVGDRIIFE